MLKNRWTRFLGAGLVAVVVAFPVALNVGWAVAPAAASACSPTAGTAAGSACTVSTGVTLNAGTLSLESSAALYWQLTLNGYDQWGSASASALSCSGVSSSGTTCSGGSAPALEVVDASGAGAGWAVSEYLASGSLPTGSVLSFDGNGSATIGDSQVSSIGTDPFASAAPTTKCDANSTCTVASAATTCSHSALGFTVCPTYPVNLAAGTSATTQADMYSAASSSGIGAICLGSGTATTVHCGGLTPDDYYNLGVPAGDTAGSTAGTMYLTVSSGP